MKVLVRAYSPLGFYPVKALSHSEGIFVLDHELIFSAAPKHKVQAKGYFPERVWINPAELRLLASLALSVPHCYGKVYVYPDVAPVIADLNNDDVLTDTAVQQHLKERLVEGISKRSATHDQLYFKPVPQPPRFSNHQYRYNDNASDVDHQTKIFKSIDLSDALMVRGLGALLKGALLNVHQIFHTEACMSLYVAMEASMEIIRRRLKPRIEEPEPKDASRYLAEAFDSSIIQDRYFAPYVDDRIKTVHPNSRRFGAFPYAPLAADDYCDLYNQLRSVYDFLVSGRIDPAYKGR